MAIHQTEHSLPPIPEKLYFTIGEVSKLCDLKTHVLRYWEQEFSGLMPARRGNRRYYRHEDVVLIRKIRHLLYDEGFTVEGARHQLKMLKIIRDKPEEKLYNAVRSAVVKLQKVVNELEHSST
jgi:DNA-binding transcriptional MerR regulator